MTTTTTTRRAVLGAGVVVALVLAAAGTWVLARDGGGTLGLTTDAVPAVDHVGDVLLAAGHETPRIRGLVGYACGPTDAVLGVRATDDPVTVDVPWHDVAPVLQVRGRPLVVAREDPAAGVPTHVDRVSVARDGWEVRWGESSATTVADGTAATVVTIVGGGEVDGDALRGWEQAGLVAEVWPCG